MGITPYHYEGTTDVIGLILKLRGERAAISFCFDNILKYATRMTRKGQLEDDLGKIGVYAKRIVEIVRNARTESSLALEGMLETTDVETTVKYLEGQFGDTFTLDFIQGRIIELAMCEKPEQPSPFDMDSAIRILYYSTSYLVILGSRGSLNEEVEELVEERIDEFGDIVKAAQDIGKIITDELGKYFKIN